MCTNRSEHSSGSVHNAGVLVFTGDLEGEACSDCIQRVGERYCGHARSRTRYELITVLNNWYVDATQVLKSEIRVGYIIYIINE